MTTPAAAALYLAQHKYEHEGKGWTVHNPHNKPVQELPVIYGFNNGGPSDWLQGVILAQDGTELGGHICSHEGYMPADLGVLVGTRPDRHETFRERYPDGYRMEFIGHPEVLTHEGLAAAIKLNQAQGEAK